MLSLQECWTGLQDLKEGTRTCNTLWLALPTTPHGLPIQMHMPFCLDQNTGLPNVELHNSWTCCQTSLLIVLATGERSARRRLCSFCLLQHLSADRL